MDKGRILVSDDMVGDRIRKVFLGPDFREYLRAY